MKKIINLTLMCLLAGCTTQQSIKNDRIELAKPTRRDTAPMPWVQIIPSKRAIDFKEIEFNFVARQIRHNMANFEEKFKNITLVLVDYAILPAELPKMDHLPKKHKGQIYCKKFIEKPERYFIRLSFYANNTRPPAPPVFTDAETLTLQSSPLAEALLYMINEITREYAYSPFPNVAMNLDVEPFEKSIKAPSSPQFTPTMPSSPYSRPY